MSAARQPVDRIFLSGESVPCSGLYAADHDCKCDRLELVLIAAELFPGCQDCGGDARFTLLRPAPYIHEDPDFPKS